MPTIEEMYEELSRNTKQWVEREAKRVAKLEALVRELETKGARPGAVVGDLDGGEPSEHRKAYDRFLRKGITDGLGQFTKAMSVGVDADGGYGVPEDLDRMIGRVERDATPMRQICNVIPVENETYEKLMSQGGAAGGWVGETDARPETATPTLASIKPFFGEVYANPPVTQKLLDDAFFNLEEFIAEEVGLTFAAYENTAFTKGDGTKKAKGLLSYTIKAAPAFGELLQIKSGANGSTTADKLIECTLSLKPRYLQNARWMMSSATLLSIRQIKNATGDYLLRPGLEKAAPPTLLGYEVTLNEEMPAPSSNGHCIAFGDFKRGYKIADVKNTRILRDPYTKKGFVLFYTTKRVGGGVEDSNALLVHTFAQ